MTVNHMNDVNDMDVNNAAKDRMPVPVHIVDTSAHIQEQDILRAFAIEEALMDETAKDGMARLYLWRHGNAFVLGLRDRKLPCAKAVMDRWEADGQRMGVRHSGGAGVPLDSGVLNASIILPKRRGDLHFHDDFRFMFHLIQAAVGHLVPAAQQRVVYGEIAGSYCPGDFDMSIDGRKFCGLAQRRQIKAISIQSFIVVEGDGEERVRRAQRFYVEATCQSEGKKVSNELKHPIVRSGSMASLQQLVGIRRVEHFSRALKEMMHRFFTSVTETTTVHFSDEQIEQTVEKIRRRYDTER